MTREHRIVVLPWVLVWHRDLIRLGNRLIGLLLELMEVLVWHRDLIRLGNRLIGLLLELMELGNNRSTTITGCVSGRIICEPLWNLSISLGTVCNIRNDGLLCASYTIIRPVIGLNVTRFCLVRFDFDSLITFLSFSNIPFPFDVLICPSFWYFFRRSFRIMSILCFLTTVIRQFNSCGQRTQNWQKFVVII